MFLSLPKTFPADDIWRLEFDMSERLVSGKCKILNKIELVDGHGCLLIDCGPEFVWLDADMLVVRRTARKRKGQPIGHSIHLSDYRPLKGTLLSIPWRIEIRSYDFDPGKPISKASRRLIRVEYITVTRALANRAVSLRR